MAEGGYENPVYEPDDVDPDDRGNEDKDEQTPDETTSLIPGGDPSTSEPGNPMSTHLPTERSSTTADTSFTERLPDPPGLSTVDSAKSRLEKEFPFFDQNKIKYRLNDQGRLEVGLYRKDRSGKLKRYILLTTQEKIDGKFTGKYKINPALTDEIKEALRKSRRETIRQKREKLAQEAKK